MPNHNVILFDIDDTLYSSEKCRSNALSDVLLEISKNHNIQLPKVNSSILIPHTTLGFFEKIKRKKLHFY